MNYKQSLSILIIFILLLSSEIQGQSLYFLNENPSPQLRALGVTGVSVPNYDAFGFYINPAMLGYFGKKNNLSLHIYPRSYSYNSYGINLGYNLEKELNGFNLSIGAGFIRRSSSSKTLNPLKNFNNSYNAYGLGASIDYYVTLALGLTFKSMHSETTQISSGGWHEGTLDANVIDYGFLLILPVTDLFENTINLTNSSKLIPEFNYSLGYSRINNGDEVSYSLTPDTKEALPLTARLGHTFNFGLNYKADDIFINMIGYDLILEADDILVKSDFNRRITYQGMLGDINFGKHLIQLKSDDNVVVHKGHAIQLFEIVTIMKGSFLSAYYKIKTSGFTLSSRGLFNWLSLITKSSTFKYIADHIEFKYINSSYRYGTPYETNLSGLSLSFFNYSFN